MNTQELFKMAGKGRNFYKDVEFNKTLEAIIVLALLVDKLENRTTEQSAADIVSRVEGEIDGFLKEHNLTID